MKKLLFVWLFMSLFIWGCNNSSEKVKNVELENWAESHDTDIWYTYSQQISSSNYLKDINSYFSYGDYSLEGWKFLWESLKINVKFDENSTVQGCWLYNSEKIKNENWVENSEINFSLNLEEIQEDSNPFVASWSLDLLYKDENLFANFHDFSLFMWEWNMDAKLYTLLLDLVKDKWVDLEVGEWWIFQVLNDDNDLSNLWTMLLMPDIVDDLNFSWAVESVLWFISNYIDLWFSINNLELISLKPIKYGEYEDWILQKTFEWTFKSDSSEFDIYLKASGKWFELKIFNIRAFDDEWFYDLDSVMSFLIEEKKQDYKIIWNIEKYSQEILSFEWSLKFLDDLSFDVDFYLNPIELAEWERISWKINWYYSNDYKKTWNIPVLSWDILKLSEMINAMI